MAYEVRYTDETNKGFIVVEDNTINTDTSLQLPGRFVTGYGQSTAENFLHLLENFASTSAPENPVEGQLWYDTTDNANQLKVYDGTVWVSAGGLKTGNTEPSVSNSVAGNLWADTDNQQLYMFTGSSWILIGPSFSSGLRTGATPQTITGQDNLEYTVLSIEVEDQKIAIIAFDEFIPKTKIKGYSTIFPGINLADQNIDSSLPNFKFIGTSEKAENLVVSGETISASNFLRGDVPSTTDFQLRVKNNTGIKIGTGGETDLYVEGQASVLQNNSDGANIDFRIRNGDSTRTVIRVDSTQNVGINNLAPDESLDVIGNIQISPDPDDATTGILKIESTVQSDAINEGSIITKGGIGVAKNAFIGGNIDIGGVTTAGNIIPDTNITRQLGSNTQRWENVYSQLFLGNLQGNVSGDVSGRAGSANRLAGATSFAMTGDVSSPSFAFDGQTGGSTKTFNTTISNSFISTKNQITNANNGDELLINVTSGNTGLYKISKQNFLKTIPLIPAGVIVPFGGVTPPVGWLLCDGSEVRKSDYNELFLAIGFNFLDASLVSDNGVNFFALPDFRGRFPLGADNMGGISANRVTSTAADQIGNSSGTETKEIDVANLPEHEHDLRGDSGAQYYAIRDNSGTLLDDEAIQYDAPTGTGAGQAFPSSGGIKSTANLGQPLDVMNPYIAVNYIIYTGT